MRKFLILTSFTVFFLLSVSCGGTAPAADLPDGLPPEVSGYTIRSIDEIIDQDLEVMNFARDGSATLPIRTSIPVACSIVYGKTPAFGALSLDQDMAGGTHQDHEPLLANLEPETMYYFRVQGVDENGVLYLSEVMTFETPPMEEGTTQNLASPELGATVTGFSSAFGSAGIDDRWGAGSAFDDNPNTEWSSSGDGNEAWIEVALAGPAHVDSVSLQSRSMSDGTAMTLSFTITTDRGDVLGPFQLPDTSQPYTFETDFEAEVLRFDLVETTGGNSGLVDVVVNGTFLEE